ncbi:peptidoglycan recognition protein family protein [Corynebacterium callunae]|uniref:peptidoglycan recognition protein family protein n=1 Tax=Corynebacterium callunae TaxID=1721 RepID=UPI001FFFAF37|nr:N-acetylmuramoyl-L-alanine amidase [Corynebacterium callunae]MCK2200470.1 N-acetylmuramoyl-L-alanine amidase [Corynebacterium callunae]
MAPKIRDWTAKFNFGGPRNTANLIGVCIHTTENDPSTPAENVAQYQLDTESGSYHTLADRQGILRENTADWITWSTGNKGNYLLMHLSFVARAAMTRSQWLAEDAMLRNGAWEVAQWCKRFGWPVKQVSVSGLPGITTHDSTRVWGSTDHTDPGKNFPWDVFLRYVNEEIAGQSAPTTQIEDVMATDFNSKTNAADGTEHTYGQLLRYTDGRVFKMESETLPRLEKKLDEILEVLKNASK